MQNIFYPFKVIWAYYYFFVFTFFFLLFYPLLIVLLRNEKWYRAANRLRRLWALIICFFTGLPFSIRYEAPLKKKQSYIYCPNHFSYLDIPVAMLATKGNIRFMAKMELGKIPIFNIFFKTIDISVNRSSPSESYKSLQLAKESLDKNFSLVIFPEGTIGSNPPQLLNFKNGPFKMAIEKQIPIVPITMLDNWRLLHVEKKLWGRPGLHRTIVHLPIETTGLTSADENMLKEKVRNIIEQELIKAYPELLSENNTFTQNYST